MSMLCGFFIDFYLIVFCSEWVVGDKSWCIYWWGYVDYFVRYYCFFSGFQVFEYCFFLVWVQGDQFSLLYVFYVFVVGYFSQGFGIFFYCKDVRIGFDKFDVNVFVYVGF